MRFMTVSRSTHLAPRKHIVMRSSACRLNFFMSENGFHAWAFQRSSLKVTLNYAKIFVYGISLARIQRLQPTQTGSNPDSMDPDIMNIWRDLVTTIMDQLAYLINESSYRYQLTWAPTYSALTMAFVSKLLYLFNNIVSLLAVC